MGILIKMKNEPILVASLALRVLILVFVLFSGHWVGGDTNHYIWMAGESCSGSWGGFQGRPNLYAWYLCLLSPTLKVGGVALWKLAFPLLIQSLLVWSCGFLIWHRFPKIRSRRLITALLVFDPVLLVFGNFVMSDAIYTVMVFGLGLIGWQILYVRKKSFSYMLSAIFGLLLGAQILTRSVGAPIIAWTFLIWSLTQYKQFKKIALALIAMLIVLAPQAYWNKVHYGSWSVLQQAGWIHTVASAVEYNDRGLDFYEAEAEWGKRNLFADPAAPMRTFKEKFPTLVYLSLKGVARVLVGHVNVEWAALMTGIAPIGPGWFKVPERRAGPRVSGFYTVLWSAGLLVTLLICLFTYWQMMRAWANAGWMEVYSLWLMGCIALLAITPLVWGDARFRMPLWPLVLLLWATSEARQRTN